MAIKKEQRLLGVGILGCGPISQFGHLESVQKARNTQLRAVCDADEGLANRFGAFYDASAIYLDYDAMLADETVEAVIIATSDAFHVPAAIRALQAGKHVFCEKPIGLSVEEVQDLQKVVDATGKVCQVGHMLRFDPGIQSAKDFLTDEMGEILALKAWYCDSTARYTNTDAIQPVPRTGTRAIKPSENPKANLRRYNMLAHGCHLLDLARYLSGPIVEVHARHREKYGAMSWFIDVEFENRALGHLDLTLAVRMDWHEGFQIYGQNGSIKANILNPWYYRAAEVDIFREADASTHRVLGADGHFYRRQLEGFGDVILKGAPMTGASIVDGLESVRAMVAVMRSAETGQPVKLADATGAGMIPAIFSRTYPLTTAEATFAAVKADGFGAVQFNLSNLGLQPLPETAAEGLEAVREQATKAGVVISALSGTWNMAHPDPTYRATMRGRFEWVLQAAKTLGAPIVTLCTGSRDAGNMWAQHAQNTSAAAWADMARELSHALDRAAPYGLRLGIEPEPANVICDAAAARRILDQLQAPHLGIVLDAANLIAPEQAVHQQAILDHALDLLGADLLLAHAKDHDAFGRVTAPGDGIINLPAFVAGLRQAGYDGPLIGHGFDMAQAPRAATLLQDLCRR